ncbi:serine peptidase [Streptomyces sp. S1D4-11]|jgi:hypothetical protein
MSRPPSLRVVGVHGVGYLDRRRARQAVADQHAAEWAEYLAAGVGVGADAFDVAFAYYAPFLRRPRKVQSDDDRFDDPLAEQLLREWLDAMGAPAPVVQGGLTMPLRQTAAWVARKHSLDGRLTRLFIGVFFREVARYLRSAEAPWRAEAREEVATHVARHRPDVVVAHSLGTLVAYEALHAHPELQVPLLLTLGSPLALPKAVFERLLPPPVSARGSRPAGVHRWVNIADPGDPVAIPPRLARSFDGVDLDLTTTVHGGFGFHHAKNYLRCAPTAATLGPLVGR